MTDINHLKLHPALIAELYPSSLIVMEETGPDPAEIAETENIPAAIPLLKSLGDNRKNILVVVSYPDAMYLPDHDLGFLTGILGSCKLSLADVAVFNLTNHPETSYREMLAFFKSKIVFLFGVEPTVLGLPLNFPHFQIQPFAGNSFLFSPSLQELENDKVLKSKLWVCLKRIFSL